MKIVVAGGSGFLGRPLASRLALGGHEVVILTRRIALGRATTGLRYANWEPDGTAPGASRGAGIPDTEINGADVVVNMAGAGIADQRWTPARKEELRQSRILSTRSLIAAIRGVKHPPRIFVQASAIGYYGSTGDAMLDESSGPGTDFLAALCVDWENESGPTVELGCRRVVIRTGIVLAAEGGALQKLLPPFRMFAGGPIGNGRQYMSWIHLNDWVSMVAWAIENHDVTGVLNATAPKPVTNKEFSRALGRAIHRPSLLPVPRFALRALVGEMADVMLLTGQRVMPKKALELKFGFRYPDINLAMKAALGPE
jgi:uncharacterized protein